MKKKLLCTLMFLLLAVLGSSMTAMAAEVITTKIAVPTMTTVDRAGSKGNTTVSWGKVSGASGYQIQYSVNSNYSGASSVTISNGAATSARISGLSTTQDTYIRMRAYTVINGGTQYTGWSAMVKLIVWKSGWTYANYSAIHNACAVLYYAPASKNITVAVNAGHGCKGGAKKKTLCHPDGSKKVTGGSTGKGAKYATSINSGTSIRGGSEAAGNLKIANYLKTQLLADGYNVLMIRQNSNTQLDNIARTVMANNNASCHIAIHFDSTRSNKGAFYISVPSNKKYRSMEPVKSHWTQHNALGTNLVKGLRSAKVKIFKKGSMAIDLTQTSYSTIPSVDIEVGDRKTSTSAANLIKIASGLHAGVKLYFGK